MPCRSSSAARVPRVLAQHDVGRAQLREHAQRHVLEVADRRRADGERHLRPRRAPRTRRTPRRSGRPPCRARRGTTRTLSRIGRSASRRSTSSAARDQVRPSAATPKPPPITISSGAKMFANEPMPGAEVAADVGEDLARLSRRPRPRAGRAGARRRPARTPPARPASPRARSRTPRDARDRGRRPGTAGRRGRSRRGRARRRRRARRGTAGRREITPPPTPGAERQHHEVVDAAAGAGAPLADRGGVRVVVEPDRQAEALASCGRGAGSRRAGGSRTRRRRPSTLVDRRRHAEADRRDLVVEQLLDRRLELADDRFLRVLRRRALVPADDLARRA